MIQNVCVYEGSNNLDGFTFNIINQSKIIFGAIFLSTMGFKKYSSIQVVCLAVLFICIILLTSSDAKHSDEVQDTKMDRKLGISCTICASLLSGLNSALMQNSLQNRGRNSLQLSSE
eukprot:UN24246